MDQDKSSKYENAVPSIYLLICLATYIQSFATTTALIYRSTGKKQQQRTAMSEQHRGTPTEKDGKKIDGSTE